jgi:hypothetical protein
LNLGGTFGVAVYSRVKGKGVKTIFGSFRDRVFEDLKIPALEKHNRKGCNSMATTIGIGSSEFDSKKTLSRD